MMTKMYPDGVYDFRSLVTGGYYFVDKTLMIRDVCKAEGQVLLYTRPRRFGKSINLSMLDYFFNMKYKDKPDLFKGSKISSCKECGRHKNAYPVIRMDFSRLVPSSPLSLEDSLKEIVSRVADSIPRESLTDASVRLLDRCSRMELSESGLNSSIADMCEVLDSTYGNRTIVLVDEYDHVFQNIASEDAYDILIKRIRPFMEQTFKTNAHMRTGVITGIMPLMKAGMLSSFNNPKVMDVLSMEGNEHFGFTEQEVGDLLKDTGYDDPATMGEIRDWYDGYKFGSSDIYNPYSVVKYLQSRSNDENKPARSYWDGSTGGGLSSELVSRIDGVALQELKSLYQNPESRIRTELERSISYPDLFEPDTDPKLVYSYLVMAGYLRAEPSEDGDYDIAMVNREIAMSFRSLVDKAAEREADVSIGLRAHMLTGDAKSIRDDLQFILGGHSMDSTWKGGCESGRASDKAAHDRYKNALCSALRASGMKAFEEFPKGLGACDIFVPGDSKHPAIVVEIKTSWSKPPASSAATALRQIYDKGYSSEPGDENVVWIAIGISGKRVAVITPRERSWADSRSESDECQPNTRA